VSELSAQRSVSGGGGSLRQQDRILIAHGDHGAAQRDALGVLADGGEERKGDPSRSAVLNSSMPSRRPRAAPPGPLLKETHVPGQGQRGGQVGGAAGPADAAG
jgi:hypothetical protein